MTRCTCSIVCQQLCLTLVKIKKVSLHIKIIMFMLLQCLHNALLKLLLELERFALACRAVFVL